MKVLILSVFLCSAAMAQLDGNQVTRDHREAFASYLGKPVSGNIEKAKSKGYTVFDGGSTVRIIADYTSGGSCEIVLTVENGVVVDMLVSSERCIKDEEMIRRF